MMINTQFFVDIKPQNILVAVDGTIRISDFGVADVFVFYCKNERN